MIDLHLHLLPGVDDGPPTEADSLDLAGRLVEEGVTAVAVTPHVRFTSPSAAPEELAARVALLRVSLQDAGIALEVTSGAEVDLEWALQADDESLRLCSYGQRGTDVLIETPYGPVPDGFDALLARLRARGYRVLLAHPERSSSYHRDPPALKRLVERGVLLQVTAGALANRRRRSMSRAMAHALVKEGLAHVVASDAHSIDPEFRPPLMAAGLRVAQELNPERADWMSREVPAALLAGEPLPQPPGPSRRAALAGRRGWAWRATPTR